MSEGNETKKFSILATAVIAGIFSVFGAGVSAYVQKEGLPWSPERKVETIVINGKARDIPLNDFREDFASYEPKEYIFNSGTIEIDGQKTTVDSDVDFITSDGESYTGKITGEGKMYKGTATILYEGDIPSKNIHWNGVLVLKIPSFGEMKGYWLTEHAFHRGEFAFGEVVLKRK